MGSRIAARARPFRLERGVLHVRAASAAWSQELAFLGDVIAEQLRARGVAVTSLRFHVGEVPSLDRPPSRQEPRRAPPEAPLPPGLDESLARIENDELRAAVARAASRNLGWQAMIAAEPTTAKPKRGR